ncbi:MAG: hypothetical protein PUK40_03935 [Actinomycetaceae bacterium]|nr:hypothetical protein [Arcanobacterium sp.]MDD7505088.1 hypothetical protein [Actinomycetaceae bacterium]
MNDGHGEVKRQHTYGVLVVLLCALAVVIALPRITPNPMASYSGMEPRARTVVVLGFTGVPWSSVNASDSPNLYAFAGDSAIANNVVKTASPYGCPNAAWLTLNAGKRARDAMESGCTPQAVLEEVSASHAAGTQVGGAGANGSGVAAARGGATIADYARYLEANADNPSAPQFGSFAKVLNNAGVSTAAVGAGASLALADATGSVAALVKPLVYDAGIAAAPGEAVRGGLAHLGNSGGVMIVDLGSVRSADYPLGQPVQTLGRVASSYSAPRFDTSYNADQVRSLDAAFGEALSAIPDDAIVIAASLSEADPITDRMQYFALRSGTSPAVIGASHNTLGVLVAPSTRRIDLVQSTDIPPTVFAALGIDRSDDPLIREAFMGTPLRIDYHHKIKEDRPGSDAAHAQPANPTINRHIATLVDSVNRAIATHSSVGWYMTFLGVIGLIAIPALLFAYRRRWASRAVLYGSLWVGAIPVSALLVNLIPWWRMPFPRVMMFAMIYAGAAIASAVIGSAASRWYSHKRTASSQLNEVGGAGLTAGGILASFTLSVFIVDAAWGSPLHSTSVLGGQQPQAGARFYGFGNYAHIVIALSALYVAVWLAWRIIEQRLSGGRALTATILVGAITLYASVSTAIGADFGGTLGIIVAFVIVGFAVYGKKLHPRTIVITFGVGVMVMAALAILDWMRPPEYRTHIGNFVQEIIDGGFFHVIARKVAFFAGTATPLAWLGTLAGVVLLYAVAYRAVRWWESREAAELAEVGIVPREGDTSPSGVSRIGYARRYFHALYWHSVAAALVLIVVSTLINDSGILIPFVGTMFMVPTWLVLHE